MWSLGIFEQEKVGLCSFCICCISWIWSIIEFLIRLEEKSKNTTNELQKFNPNTTDILTCGSQKKHRCHFLPYRAAVLLTLTPSLSWPPWMLNGLQPSLAGCTYVAPALTQSRCCRCFHLYRLISVQTGPDYCLVAPVKVGHLSCWSYTGHIFPLYVSFRAKTDTEEVKSTSLLHQLC